MASGATACGAIELGSADGSRNRPIRVTSTRDRRTYREAARILAIILEIVVGSRLNAGFVYR
jgi:hypothetical protein